MYIEIIFLFPLSVMIVFIQECTILALLESQKEFYLIKYF